MVRVPVRDRGVAGGPAASRAATPGGGTGGCGGGPAPAGGTQPRRLVSIALPDTVGDVRVQNQPGTDTEYPNWQVPLCDAEGHAVALEDLIESDLLRRLVAAVGAEPRVDVVAVAARHPLRD